MRYLKVKKKSRTFFRLFWVSVSEFETIISKILPEWQKKVLGSYKGLGRPYDHRLEDMVLMLLLYYRRLHHSRICWVLFGLAETPQVKTRGISYPQATLASDFVQRQFLLRLWGCFQEKTFVSGRLRL